MALQKKPIIDEINITPLTDIFLVLLIIMMVVAPMMQSEDQSIQPPSVQAGSKVSPGRLTVEVTSTGEFKMDGEPVAESNLVAVLKEQSKVRQLSDEDKNLVIRADKGTRSGAVMKVFEAARDAAFLKVTVAGLSADQVMPPDTEGSAGSPVPSTADELFGPDAGGGF